MLKRHPRRRPVTRRTLATAVNAATAGITSPLALPVIGRGIPRRWEYNAGSDRLLRIANFMVDKDLFTPADLVIQKRRKQSLKDRIQDIFTDRFDDAHPSPMSKIGVRIVDEDPGLNVEWPRYVSKYNHYANGQTQTETQLGALMAIHGNEVHTKVIGETLNALEAWPRLGQTVMAILDKGLRLSTRGLTPGTALDWCSMQYWSGELDEELKVQEILDEEREDALERFKENHPTLPPPTDEQLVDTLDIIRRKAVEELIPAKWHRRRQPLKQLPQTLPSPDPKHVETAVVACCAVTGNTPKKGVTLTETFALEDLRARWPEIRSACEGVITAGRRDADNDNELCENIAYEATPFMLRMSDQDVMQRVLDDTMEMYYQCGEADVGINAVFLWHDAASLLAATRRCENYFALIQACTNLVRTLLPHSHETENRVRITV